MSCDTIAAITKQYEQSGFVKKTRLSIIRELLDQNIISSVEYEELVENNKRNNDAESSPMTIKSKESIQEEFTKDNEDVVERDVKILKDYMSKQGKTKFILWLQDLLFEVCYVKLALKHRNEFKEVNHIMEPTVYYFVLLDLPIPVIPWTNEQSNIMKYQPFLLLLHKLGFYLPKDTGRIFVQIPNFWTADYTFNIAQQLGPINSAKLKFSTSILGKQNTYNRSNKKSQDITSCIEPGKFSMIDLKGIPQTIRYTPLPITSEWFQIVAQKDIVALMDCTSTYPSSSELSIAIPDSETLCFDLPPPELAIVERRCTKGFTTNMECSPIYQQVLTDDIEKNSNCDTVSVASDLTRMCVSDEEEKK